MLLFGCSTPRPILDLAGEGAATVGLAEASLRDYVNVTNNQLTARMELLRKGAEGEARDRADRALDLMIDGRAGVPAREASPLIQTLGDDSRRIREQEAAALQKITETSTLDVDTLAQVPTAKLDAAKKAFAVLAQELTPREWLALAAAYANEIRTGVDSIRSALEKKESIAGK
jgi:hypothetical protein